MTGKADSQLPKECAQSRVRKQPKHIDHLCLPFRPISALYYTANAAFLYISVLEQIYLVLTYQNITMDITLVYSVLQLIEVSNCKSKYGTLRSLINVQHLITVQGVTLFYKKFKVSSGLGLFPFLRPLEFQEVQIQPSRNIFSGVGTAYRSLIRAYREDFFQEINNRTLYVYQRPQSMKDLR